MLKSAFYLLIPLALSCTPNNESNTAAIETPGLRDISMSIEAYTGTGDIRVSFPVADTGYKDGDKVSFYWEPRGSEEPEKKCDQLKNHELVTLKVVNATASFMVKDSPENLQLPTDPSKEMKYDIDSATAGSIIVEGCLATGEGQQVSEKQNDFPIQSEATIETTAFQLAATVTDNIKYGKRCAEALGYIKPFSCVGDGTLVPIHVNGQEVNETVAKCDNPIFLNTGPGGHCKPFSRVGRLTTYEDPSYSTVKNGVQTAFICRAYEPTTATSKIFQDVAIIQTNLRTGETCFFQHLGPADTARVSPPHETDEEFAAAKADSGEGINEDTQKASQFWLSPQATANIGCNGCHDNDPFMHNPWIDGAKKNNQPVIPAINRALTNKTIKYIGADLGFDRWATQYSIKTVRPAPDSVDENRPENWPNHNSCTNCHSISSMATCETWSPNSAGNEPTNPSARDAFAHLFDDKTDSVKNSLKKYWMPTHAIGSEGQWQNQYGSSVDAIDYCCNLIGGGANYYRSGSKYGKGFTAEELDDFKAKGCDLKPISENIFPNP